MSAVIRTLTSPPPPSSSSSRPSAKVLLLESPTGSGKSLSLFVSCYEYLLHRSKLDDVKAYQSSVAAKAAEGPRPTEGKGAVASAAVGSRGGGGGLAWLDGDGPEGSGDDDGDGLDWLEGTKKSVAGETKTEDLKDELGRWGGDGKGGGSSSVCSTREGHSPIWSSTSSSSAAAASAGQLTAAQHASLSRLYGRASAVRSRLSSLQAAVRLKLTKAEEEAELRRRLRDAGLAADTLNGGDDGRRKLSDQVACRAIRDGEASDTMLEGRRGGKRRVDGGADGGKGKGDEREVDGDFCLLGDYRSGSDVSEDDDDDDDDDDDEDDDDGDESGGRKKVKHLKGGGVKIAGFYFPPPRSSGAGSSRPFGSVQPSPPSVESEVSNLPLEELLKGHNLLGGRPPSMAAPPGASDGRKGTNVFAHATDDDDDEKDGKAARSRFDGKGFGASASWSHGPSGPVGASGVSSTNVFSPDLPPSNGVRKILYAARTHSQLSQFVSEIRKTHWGRTVAIVHLGGRKQQCGNRNVNDGKRGEERIGEECLDLQKGKGKGARALTVAYEGKEDEERGAEKGGSKAGDKRTSVSEKGSKRPHTRAGGCPLLSSPSSLSLLSLHVLSVPSDIEDLASLSLATGTCSYYASRSALPAAEVVVLPYATLLSAASRKAVGLELGGNIVIVDEAHNAPEALRSISSHKVSRGTVLRAMGALEAYLKKYKSRLGTSNLFYIGMVRKVVEALAKFLDKDGSGGAASSAGAGGGGGLGKPPQSSAQEGNKILDINTFLFDAKLDNVNLFKIDRYLTRSGLCRKLLGFLNFEDANATPAASSSSSEAASNSSTQQPFVSRHISPLSVVQSFLAALSNRESMGRIIVERSSPDASSGASRSTSSGSVESRLRYFLLDPSDAFREVVREAEAVILLGGTLKPFGHICVELFGTSNGGFNVVPPGGADGSAALVPATTTPASGLSGGTAQSAALPPLTVTALSCGHVVPPSHIYALAVGLGPTGTSLDFRHGTRGSPEVIDELGRVVLNVCSVVPGGVIVFLPSYGYEAEVVRRWKHPAPSSSASATSTIWDQLAGKKKLHREPKEARDLDAVLSLYAADAKRRVAEPGAPAGALLLCVIGGKMSEGINFADDMARGVVVAGLPFPDLTDPELKEKMEHLDRAYGAGKDAALARSAGGVGAGAGAGAGGGEDGITGQAYYFNLCMRAVNQSVGRAIRHARDYAAIVLCDCRYVNDRKVWNALPEWIKGGGGFGGGKGENVPFGKIVLGLRQFFKDREGV